MAPEPTRRLTIPKVLESLTTLQRDAAATVASSVGFGGRRSVRVVVPRLPAPKAVNAAVYDVLAIIDAMEALAIEPVIVSAVVDTVGVSLLSTLDPLTAHKVPIMKVAAVRRAVATSPPPHTATVSV